MIEQFESRIWIIYAASQKEHLIGEKGPVTEESSSTGC